MTDWLVRASDLLAEPDPGPTPMLVDGLIVDRSLAAIVGTVEARQDMGAARARHLDRDGVARVRRPGSPEPRPGHPHPGGIRTGRAPPAPRRTRPRKGDRPGAPPDLHAAANQRVRLDDPDWQKRLAEAANELEARAVFLDPIARLRRAGLDENSQREYAVVIEAIRDLRENTNAAVAWVAHTGHTGDNMRGSSDLESVWESRLAFRRDGNTVTITTEHREAEPGDPIAFDLAWHHETRTMRLRSTPTLDRATLPRLPRRQRPATTDEIAAGINVRRSDVKRTMDSLSARGTARRQPVPRTDKAGRHVSISAWDLNSHAALSLHDAPSHNGTARDGRTLARRAVPPLRGVDGDGTSDGTAHGVLA